MQVNNLVFKNLDTSLDSYSRLGYDLLEQKYPGEWRVDGDKLLKGNKLINGDTEFVDAVKTSTKAPATIFLGDTRVSTNVLKEGKRIEGTKVSPAVAEIVLTQGKEYIGEANVDGSIYESKYVPIKDNSGKVIGIWFIGVEKATITKQVNSLMLTIGILTLIVLLLAILVSTMFIKPIIKNVKKILNSLTNISNGDLTESCSVSSYDETRDIAEGLNLMSKNVSALVHQIKDSSSNLKKNSDNLSAISKEMSNSSEEVARAIQDVAIGAGTQAGDLVETTGILNTFGDEIETIVDSIKTIDSNAKSISLTADESNEEMRYLIDSIRNMSTTFDSFMVKLSDLGHNIGKINDITNLINSVAEQTNLLALNAAIEAARAGEAGRGFSVVAEEIRKLAEQSKNSSQDINNLITNISVENAAIVNSSGDMNNEIKRQMEVINTTISSFKQIIQSLTQVTPLIESVNTRIGSINNEKDTIITKIEGLSAVSEEVSASSEEIAASSEEMSASAQEVTATAQILNAMTDEMLNQVSKFKLS
jgi:methyl-accepting chemotaxis protein